MVSSLPLAGIHPPTPAGILRSFHSQPAFGSVQSKFFSMASIQIVKDSLWALSQSPISLACISLVSSALHFTDFPSLSLNFQSLNATDWTVKRLLTLGLFTCLALLSDHLAQHAVCSCPILYLYHWLVIIVIIMCTVSLPLSTLSLCVILVTCGHCV